MKFAFHFPATDHTADPGDVACEIEQRGLDGILFPEHTHMPVDHEASPYSGTEDRMVKNRRLFSPFTSMAWAAARTSRISIGTCVSLPAQYHPIVLAKTLASLDHLSKGRIVYGVGYGWLEQEMIDFGVDPKRKRALVREHILAVREIWTKEKPSFSGEFVEFPPCWCWPKPPEANRLPILMGAAGSEKTLDHVVEYCDGWMPSIRGNIEAFSGRVARLREKALEAGRDPASLKIDVIAPFRSVELFEGFREVGVGRVILHLPFADFDTVRRTLDEYDRDYFRHFAK